MSAGWKSWLKRSQRCASPEHLAGPNLLFIALPFCRTSTVASMRDVQHCPSTQLSAHLAAISLWLLHSI